MLTVVPDAVDGCVSSVAATTAEIEAATDQDRASGSSVRRSAR